MRSPDILSPGRVPCHGFGISDFGDFPIGLELCDKMRCTIVIDTQLISNVRWVNCLAMPFFEEGLNECLGMGIGNAATPRLGLLLQISGAFLRSHESSQAFDGNFKL